MSYLIRNALFQMYRYSPVTFFNSHYKDLTSFYKSKQSRSREIDHRLNRILQHAVESTDYYSQIKNYSCLQDFPVIQKSLIKENISSFLSSDYSRKSLKKSSTSGSYGSPFVCYMTKTKKIRQIAEVVFFSHLVGFKAGMKHVNIASRHPSRFYTTVLNQIVKNPTVIDEIWLEELKNILLRRNVEFIVSYTSALVLFAEYCIAHKIPIERSNLKGIITIAEPLPKSRKDYLEQVFQCKVTSRYATMESGVIAQQLMGNDWFMVNTGSYFIELLSLDSDMPARTGEPGRIVITDFFSHALPLIRYDIGDIGISHNNTETGVQKLVSVEGRQVEMITRPDGTPVSPMAIDDIMEEYTEISQFQFIQESLNSYILKVVISDGKISQSEIYNKFRVLLGVTINFKIENVLDIPALPSGKRPVVINQINKK